MCLNMSEEQDLVYSLDAMINSMHFFQDINKIHIVVEDYNKQAEYESIFKRLLKDQYRIEKIFTVGGKQNVKYCYEQLKNDSSLPVVFIVDGDFDRYKNPSEMILDDRFIYLKKYNIESYFIDEKACMMFAKTYLHKLDEEVKDRLKFYYWESTIVAQAKDLFFLYCYIQIYNPKEINVSRNPYLFIDSKTGFKRNDGAFEEFKERIYAQDENAEQRVQDIVLRYESINGQDYCSLICGKFLLTSLKCYLHNIVEVNFRDNDLRWYLINNFDVDELDYVREGINRVLFNKQMACSGS